MCPRFATTPLEFEHASRTQIRAETASPSQGWMFRTRCEHPKRGLALQLADIQPEPSQYEGNGDQAYPKANSAMISLHHRVLSGFKICLLLDARILRACLAARKYSLCYRPLL
jgi:hypothetical protein